MKKLRRDKIESEQIHDELFKTTTEYQYYLFGMAHGLYFIYKTMYEYKDYKSLETIEWMKVIKKAVNSDEKILKNFNRLLKDI